MARTRLLWVALLWILVLFGTLAIIQNRLSDAGGSLEKKLTDSKLNREVEILFGLPHFLFHVQLYVLFSRGWLSSSTKLVMSDTFDIFNSSLAVVNNSCDD